MIPTEDLRTKSGEVAGIRNGYLLAPIFVRWGLGLWR